MRSYLLSSFLLHETRHVAIGADPDRLGAVPQRLPDLPGTVLLSSPDRERAPVVANAAGAGSRCDRDHIEGDLRRDVAGDDHRSLGLGKRGHLKILKVLFPPRAKFLVSINRGVVWRHAY